MGTRWINAVAKDINSWVNQKTEGMIDMILDEIRDDAVMYLINAIVFDADWERIYKTRSIIPSIKIKHLHTLMPRRD